MLYQPRNTNGKWVWWKWWQKNKSVKPIHIWRSTKAGYLICRSAKKGTVNIKNGVKATRGFNYPTLDAKKAFNGLRHLFTQTPILQHFDLERHIRIETDTSGYAIDKVLNQLTLDNLGQKHLIAYYSQKIS